MFLVPSIAPAPESHRIRKTVIVDAYKKFQDQKTKRKRTAEAFRFPGTVIAGNAWRQEQSCRLFAFTGACSGGCGSGRGSAKSSEKALVKRFCEKNFTEFLLDLKKWSAFFYLPPLPR